MDAYTLHLAGIAAAAGGAVFGLVGWRRARAASHGGGVLRALVAPLAVRLRPSSQEDLERLVTRLQQAGRRDREDVDRHLQSKLVAFVLGAAVALTLGATLGGAAGLFLFCAALLAGLLATDRLLDARGRERRNAVARGLPSAVDLLVTCLDAGLSLEHAIARVSVELAHSDPILAEELRITASEFEAGVSLPDALRRLSRRVALDDLSAMCGVIAQASSLGAPIAQTLREYAISSRRQRLSVLEERAGKLSAQLTIPLAVCLLPAALILILGPAAVQLVQALSR